MMPCEYHCHGQFICDVLTDRMENDSLLFRKIRAMPRLSVILAGPIVAQQTRPTHSEP